nr:uncharacterized protein LOC104100172 [Nicotiana tomentosiformis]
MYDLRLGISLYYVIVLVGIFGCSPERLWIKYAKCINLLYQRFFSLSIFQYQSEILSPSTIAISLHVFKHNFVPKSCSLTYREIEFLMLMADLSAPKRVTRGSLSAMAAEKRSKQSNDPMQPLKQDEGTKSTKIA